MEAKLLPAVRHTVTLRLPPTPGMSNRSSDGGVYLHRECHPDLRAAWLQRWAVGPVIGGTGLAGGPYGAPEHRHFADGFRLDRTRAVQSAERTVAER
ncbi:hypothetical protein [Streptomyces sp. NPDC056069]|uniref:hypothetical protein n=1 Tax=Streptomyces sp. NPDC056069 TaxID=3345702 RepID=UPI0035DA137B